MRSIMLFLSVCSLLFVSSIAQAGLPEADAILTRAAAFQKWGERMYRQGDITAAEAAFYQAGELESEAAELELAEVDQRAFPVIQQLALIVEERFDRLGEVHTEVSNRLQLLEEKLTKRLESSGEGLRIDFNDLSGNLEDLSAEARKALEKLQSEFTELTDDLFADRGSRDRDDDEDARGDRPDRRGRGREASDRDRRGSSDRDRGDSPDRGRRMHIHAAMMNLNAPPIHHHMRESIEHLHAAGLHEAAEQLDRALDAAREQVKDAFREAFKGSGEPGRGHHPPHRGPHAQRPGDGHHERGHHAHDRDHHAQHSGDQERDGAHHSHERGHHSHHRDHHAHHDRGDDHHRGHPHHRGHHAGPPQHHRGPDHGQQVEEQLERLTRHVRELTVRVDQLEDATKKKKKKSRDED